VRIEGMKSSYFSPAARESKKFKLPGLFRKVNIVFGPALKAGEVKENFEKLIEFYKTGRYE